MGRRTTDTGSAMERFQPWWGDFELAPGSAGRWTIGPLRLWAEHHPREWRIAYRNDGDPRDDSSRVETGLPLGQAEPEAAVERYSFGETSAHLAVVPLLADRPVVSRPELPLFVPPQQSITLYVSSPLWLQLRGGDQAVLLREMPVVRPSDTWSGPLTELGGLCYHSSTMALTSLDDFPFSPWRAVTPIRFANRADDTVAVERLSLPVPYLSLFQAPDGTLWTQAVELEHRADAALNLAQLGSRPPREAGGAQRLAAARSHADRNLLAKAFGSLFGFGGSDDDTI